MRLPVNQKGVTQHRKVCYSCEGSRVIQESPASERVPSVFVLNSTITFHCLLAHVFVRELRCPPKPQVAETRGWDSGVVGQVGQGGNGTNPTTTNQPPFLTFHHPELASVPCAQTSLGGKE